MTSPIRPARAVPLLLMLLLPAVAAAQETGPSLTGGDALSISIGGRLQTQFNTTDREGEPTSQLFIRRARIELAVRVNDLVSGAIQPDFGEDEVELKDAFLQLNFSPGLYVMFGRAYRPFGLVEQTSSKRILPIERGLKVRGLDAADEYAFLNRFGYTDRDIGIQVRGEPERAPLGLTYQAGVLRGPLHGEAGDRDSYQLAGRVTLSPVEDVRIGAGWSSVDFAAEPAASPDLERGHAFEADLEIGGFEPGVHVIAEVSRADVDPFADLWAWGAHSWLAYRTGALGPSVLGLEPLLRVSVSRTNGTAPGRVPAGGTLVTPGLNLYLTPLNRLMVNYELWYGEDGSPDARSLKAQFQLGF